MNQNEQRVLDDIARYGCHVLHVLEDGELPPFSYSVGIQRTLMVPEVIVIGLPRQLAHFIVNQYSSRARAGESFTSGKLFSGFLEGFDVRFEPVDRSYYAEYLGWGRWLYQGDDFETVQLIYPTTDGVWPDDSVASAHFKARQPLLGRQSANPAG